MVIFNNFPFIAALLGVGIAQFLKVPIFLIVNKRFNWGLMISNGGMPSSHSCSVCALSTGVGMETGFDSAIFAVSAMFAIITMFDAAGVRRQAGEQASLLNQLRKDFSNLTREIRTWQEKSGYEKQADLKELLGHKPVEVYSGAVLGVIIALVTHQLFW